MDLLEKLSSPPECMINSEIVAVLAVMRRNVRWDVHYVADDDQLELIHEDFAQSKTGSSYQQHEVAMEALVDLCRQPMFVTEIYANFDCDITCSNVFEDIAYTLSKSAFPVNGPLSAMHILALI
ncbi:hypothetical protein V6N12_044969 [Hibiscus sabdariffa]|uniref:Mon2/Sec7/BIG1-like HUS domain-containing protein n=1 Tax=Hibiscus sabdariffa TaxID=183260 RepID=A0ABR2G1G5_9ROSI